MSVFQERILNNPAVCNNCFRRIRRERSQRESATLRSDVSARRSLYTRVKQTTSVDYVPAERASEAIAVFCECGTESAFDRIWDDGENRCLTTRRVKTLLKACIRTLETLGVTLDRKTTIALALQHYRDDHDFNSALKAAVETGVHRSVAQSANHTAAPLSD